jgi:serine protease Do
MTMNRKKTVVVSMASASLVVGGFMAGRMTQTEPVQAQQSEQPTPAVSTPSGHTLPSFATLASQVSSAVVYIKVVAVEKAAEFRPNQNPFGDDSPFPFRFPFPGPPQGGFRRQGSGSGFIIRKDGIILTNNHVVDDAKEIMVTLTDKREYRAKVLGRDPKTDLAVLKIEPKGDLPVARMGDSEALNVGNWVMAIGNPFGLSNTVTAGIVSAKGRTIGAGPYDDFIQTDASINPGNSGGPLFNEHGEVVGINSAIFSRGGGNIGIGFAIPINMAKKLLPELETAGSVTRGWLGVAIQRVTPDLAQSLKLSEPQGALVADVTHDGPADKGGLKRGDVIVAYNGQKVEESSALPTLVAETTVGKTVPLEVVRNGKTQTIEITIAKLSDETARDDSQLEVQKGKWGLALRELRPDERERLSLKSGEGVMVGEVQPESPAAEADIEAGDVILEVNQTPVGSVANLKRELAKVKDDQSLLLLLRRADGNNRFASLASE